VTSDVTCVRVALVRHVGQQVKEMRFPPNQGSLCSLSDERFLLGNVRLNRLERGAAGDLGTPVA